MGRAAKRKREKYQPHIDMLRSAQAVVAGLRKIVFRPCAFTSLGGLSADSVKFINAAAGLLKHKATAALRLRPRDDGLLPHWPSDCGFEPERSCAAIPCLRQQLAYNCSQACSGPLLVFGDSADLFGYVCSCCLHGPLYVLRDFSWFCS